MVTSVAAVRAFVLVDALVAVVCYSATSETIRIVRTGVKRGADVIRVGETETFERTRNIHTVLMNATGMAAQNALVVVDA